MPTQTPPPSQDATPLPPKAAPPRARHRFACRIRGLMLLIVVVALGCGGVVGVVNRQVHRAKVEREILAQQDVTFRTLHIPDPVIRRFTSPEPLHRGGATVRDGFRWFDGDEAWVVEDGQRRNRTRIWVFGGVQESWNHLGLAPIVIEDWGGALNDHFLARLVAAYRANGWAYRVVKRVGRPARWGPWQRAGTNRFDPRGRSATVALVA